MKVFIGRTAIYLLVFPLAIACVACRADITANPAKQQPNVQNLPLYPNAQQIKRINHDIGLGVPEHVITYTTNDSTTHVMAFYREALAKDDWAAVGTTSTANTLFYKWSNGARNPSYSLTVTFSNGSTGQTLVELRLRTLLPE